MPLRVEQSEDPFDRVVKGVALVRARLARATQALETAGIVYAVVGCNAVAHWVATADESAVRFTPDVDLLIHHSSLGATEAALTQAGFTRGVSSHGAIFLDNPFNSPRKSVRIFFANELVRPDAPMPAPPPEDSVRSEKGYDVLAFRPLVFLELTSFRDKDRMHLRDLIDVGLLGPDNVAEFPGVLGERLQFLFDNPE